MAPTGTQTSSKGTKSNSPNTKIKDDLADSRGTLNPGPNAITVTGDGSAPDKASLYILTYISTMLLTVQHSDFIHTGLVTVHRLSKHNVTV